MDSDSDDDDDPVDAKNSLIEARQQCNENHFERALVLYKEAVDSYPHKFGHEYIKINTEMVECCLTLGYADEAEAALNGLPEFNGKDSLRARCIGIRHLDEKIRKIYNALNLEIIGALSGDLANALIVAPACVKYKLWQAECLAIVGHFDVSNDLYDALYSQLIIKIPFFLLIFL